MDLNFTSPINKLSYGYSGLNILRELILTNEYRVSLFPIGQMEVDDHLDAECVKQGRKNAETYNKFAPSIRLYHQFDLAQHVGKGTHIGFPIFELDKFSKVERHHIENQDKLFVCSKWAKEIILSATNQKNVEVVPLGTRKYLDISSSAYQRNPGTECVFLNVGKWEKRKGHLLLIKAFEAAFHTEDKVELWLLPHNFFNKKEENKYWEDLYLNSKFGRAGKVRIIERLKNHNEVISLMKAADVGVWPSLAEGWNLPLLEMMSLGKHVITTNYSAHTEYCDNTNSHLIPISELELANDNKWFFDQGNWAKFDDVAFDSLVQYMRRIHREYIYSQVNNSGIITGRKYSWKNTVERLISCSI